MDVDASQTTRRSDQWMLMHLKQLISTKPLLARKNKVLCFKKKQSVKGFEESRYAWTIYSICACEHVVVMSFVSTQ
jgi:hypothetical protein